MSRLGIVISRAHRRRYSYAEYLTLEDSSSVRHEFFDGEIYAMAGGTPTHAALAATIIHLVGAQLPSGWRYTRPTCGFECLRRACRRTRT